jgi:uncharacterized membrane protein
MSDETLEMRPHRPYSYDRFQDVVLLYIRLDGWEAFLAFLISGVIWWFLPFAGTAMLLVLTAAVGYDLGGLRASWIIEQERLEKERLHGEK